MTLLIMFRNVKDDKIFLSAKFQFSVIQFVKVISDKPFCLLKALNPGLKLLQVRFITGTGRTGFDKFERDIPENVSLHRVGETAAGFQVRFCRNFAQ